MMRSAGTVAGIAFRCGWVCGVLRYTRRIMGAAAIASVPDPRTGGFTFIQSI
jgi:hypothetical protein